MLRHERSDGSRVSLPLAGVGSQGISEPQIETSGVSEGRAGRLTTSYGTQVSSCSRSRVTVDDGVSVSGLLLVALVPLGSLALCLLFLLVVYLKGGREDLEAAAKALREVRDVGVAPAVRAALERRSKRDIDPQ